MTTDDAAARSARRRAVLLAFALALLALAAVAAWMRWRPAAAPDGLVHVNGRIEGDRITVAPKVAGRVVALPVREGDTVTAGQVLARLDDRAVRARLDQAQAAHETLHAQLTAQQRALEVQRAEVAVALGAARLRVDAAQADARRAASVHAQEGRDHARARELSAQGFIGPQSLERAGLALAQSADQRDAAAAALAQAREALRDAQLGPARVRAREAELDVTRARAREAAAAVAEARSALEDLELQAPADGTVTLRFVQPGEVVAAGTPLLELVDLGRLYLKAYVPEAAIGRVRRGQPARILVDAWPGQPFDATVRYVAARAEFTPKEVQTVDERVKLVYEVRLHPDRHPGGRLGPGQPADGVIRWREDASWPAPAP